MWSITVDLLGGHDRMLNRDGGEVAKTPACLVEGGDARRPRLGLEAGGLRVVAAAEAVPSPTGTAPRLHLLVKPASREGWAR